MTMKKALLTTAYCLGLMLLLTLGSWQISRGLQKSEVLSKTASGTEAPLTLSALPDDINPLDYKSATLQGSWDMERIILLDNRIYQSQLGYEVILPFQLNSGEYILVNRGWIGQSQASNLPTPSPAPITGTLYLPKKGFTLGETFLPETIESKEWPKISLYMDLKQFAQVLKHPISPLMMVLDADNPNSLTRIWKPVVIQPERHYAYALQWFGLAIAFMVFGVIWFRRFKQ